MKNTLIFAVACATLFGMSGAKAIAQQGPGASKGVGDVKVTVEHIANGDATDKFAFKTVPAPSKTDAATKAKFSLITGDQDGNGAGLEALHDGVLPSGEDVPDANFFFNADSDGGRIGVDLTNAIDIKEINTYSWHPNTRGPQYYKLYASDGTDAAFKAKPDGSTDPVKAGWKLLATVDTRPKDGEAGGQYGISITSAGGTVGHFRYLLFDCMPTEHDDGFGNTFYSEIDVVAK